MWYLSHPFSFRHEALAIEKHLEETLKIDIYNPFYSSFEKKYIEEFDRQRLKLPEFRIKQLEKYGPDYVKQIVTKDLEAIDKADGVIGLVPAHFSIGTFMELWVAGITMKKPTYVLAYKKAEHHPWLQYTATKVFPVDFNPKHSLWRSFKKVFGLGSKQDIPLGVLDFERWWPKVEES